MKSAVTARFVKRDRRRLCRRKLLDSPQIRARGVETLRDGSHGDGNTSAEDRGVRGKRVDRAMV